jgi:hypothetical protein
MSIFTSEEYMTLRDVSDILFASGPFVDYGEKGMLYAPLIGSWDIEATWHDRDGKQKEAKGEWHFSWILGGRGIQDVLFVAGARPDQYGTTLRCYDPAMDAWQVTWMQPYGGEFVHLIGRKIGDRIVNESIGSANHRRARWSFTSITPDSFLWLGEVSADDGVTWFLEQEMRGRRIIS